MSDGLKEKVISYLTYGMLFLIVIGGLLLIYPDYRRSESLKRQNAELQAQIEEKKREIDELLTKQQRFRSDPDFIETIARQNQRVFPGELIFIFDQKD